MDLDELERQCDAKGEIDGLIVMSLITELRQARIAVKTSNETATMMAVRLGEILGRVSVISDMAEKCIQISGVNVPRNLSG